MTDVASLNPPGVKASISRKKGAYNSPLSSKRTELMLAPLLLKVYFVSTKITFRSLEIVYHMQNKNANKRD